MNKVFLSVIVVMMTMFTLSSCNNDDEVKPVEQDQELLDIVNGYSAKARQVSLLSEGRYYTDHNTAHALLTSKKVLVFMKAIQAAQAAGKFTPSVAHDFDYVVCNDEHLMSVCGLMHDTGMCGDGYYMKGCTDASGKTLYDEDGLMIMEKDDDGFDKMFTLDNSDWSNLRSFHSLNGCLHFLIHRAELQRAGLSDKDIDLAAAAIFAHSKSKSDIRNLTLMAPWRKGFDKIDGLVHQYNKEHKDAPISFNRSNLERDTKTMGVLASLTLALRVGDVSRDSHADDICQSGETVHVDRSTFGVGATNWMDEVRDADITVNGEPMTVIESKKVYAGEQNILFNDNYYDTSLGCIVHEITINDANSAFYCTLEAVNDHMGEFKTAPGINFVLRLVSKEGKATEEYKQKWQILNEMVSYKVDLSRL